MYKGYKSVERERGVALIFTLAMLGLLMMMLLAFVGSMSVKKTVSSNAANKTQLNLLVDSAAARAALQMRELEEVGNPLDYAVSKPVSSGSDNESGGAISNDTLEFTLEGNGNNIDLYKISGMVKDQHGVGVTPEWINITDDPITGKKTPVARYAYAVIPNAYPILNLRALGNEVRIGGALNEFKLSAVDSKFPNFTIDTSSGGESSYLTDKESYKILYLGDDLENYHSNLLTAYTTIGDNLVEDVYFYDDYTGSDPADFMLRRYDLGVNLTMNDGTTSQKFSAMDSDRRVPVLLFGNSATAEDEKVAMEQEFTGDDAVVYRSGGSGTYATNKSAEYLPFFKKFDKGTVTGTFDDEFQLRNQIAANLIDYTMPESATVTSDEEPQEEKIEDKYTTTSKDENIPVGEPLSEQSWKLFDLTNKGWPNYTGNKRTLYINEAGVAVLLELTDNVTQINYDVYVFPLIELIDIYGLGSTGDYTALTAMVDDYWMGMSGDVNFTIRGTATDGSNASDFKNITIYFPEYYLKPSEYVEDDGMYFLPRWSKEAAKNMNLHVRGSLAVPESSNVTVENVNIYIDAVKLLKRPSAGGNFVPVDFAKIEKTLSGAETFNINSNNSTLYAGVYTHDPRQNLNKGDWSSYPIDLVDDAPDFDNSVGVGSSSSYSNIKSFQYGNATTFGKVNSHDYDSVEDDDKDVENITDTGVADGRTGKFEIAAKFKTEDSEDRPLSTAFIRQDPLESLWELGFIHRGIKWQTINLKAVQNETDIRNIDPEYKNGDAEILDMVCLNYGERHKIDLNARGAQFPNDGSLAQKIWEELFSLSSDKIRIGNPHPDKSIELTDGDDISLNETVSDLLELGAGDDGESGGGEGDTSGSNIPSDLVLGSRNLFLRRSAIAPALYEAVKDKSTDAKQEAYVGKVIGLTDAYAYPPEVRVIVQAELLSQQTGEATDSVKKLVIMKRTLDGRYILSEILPL